MILVYYLTSSLEQYRCEEVGGEYNERLEEESM